MHLFIVFFRSNVSFNILVPKITLSYLHNNKVGSLIIGGGGRYRQQQGAFMNIFACIIIIEFNNSRLFQVWVMFDMPFAQ